MRRLLRRLAWLLARLLFVVMCSFLVLAKATQAPRAARPDFSSDRIEQSEAPLLLNLRPNDLESRIDALLARLAVVQHDGDVDELRRLGGATFPVLLPRLPNLPPALRLRLAQYLLPVTQRMLWKGASDVRSTADAYTFLMEAWKERSVDFQAPIVARWVERLADRGSDAMLVSVIEFDTYGLQALIEALPNIHSEPDAARARRLFSALAHVTGLPWSLPPASSIDETRDMADLWQRWWALHGAEYTVARGPSRWSAMLRQTRFGQWVTLATRFSFGTTKDRRRVADVLARSAPRSGAILMGCLAGVGAALALSAWRGRVLSTGRARALSALLLASVPHVSVIAACAYLVRSHSLWVTTAIAFSIFALLVPVDSAQLQKIASELASTSPRSDARPSARLAFIWRFADHAWPFLLTFIFVLENAFAIDGIGPECVRAFRTGDLHLLMGLATISTLASLLVIEFAARRVFIPEIKPPQ